MAENSVAFLLKELSTFLLQQNTNLGSGLEKDVQFIKDELGSMRAFLRDAEAKEDDVYELQEWLRQVREVASDTEDVLDEFEMKFGCHHVDGLLGRIKKILCSVKNVRARYEISSRLKNIRSRVEDISARHQRYQSTYSTFRRGSSSSDATEDGTSYVRGNALLVEEAKLVGINEPKRELISRVLADDSHLKVISVVGMGGLGKTTLVKRVYEDPTVKRKFHCHAWLTISQTFHMKVILKDLIQQLHNEIREPVPQQVECMEGNQLRAFVKDFLQERRYIIVLDDIWSMNSWEAIKYALPNGSYSSRIMLTTRIADIAIGSCIESRDYIHEMKPLPVEESWNLFCSKTFGDNCCPQNLEDVSRRILSKCKGLPLAIVAIGGLLALKNKGKLDEWEMTHRSLGGELEGIGKLEKVKNILLLSYNDLPFFLKSCLLYISIYPEDQKIDPELVIPRWIAEGFIHGKKGMTTTEVALGYLNELVNRSLIQVAEFYRDGSIRYCRVHDILREIILTKSREQNFVNVASSCSRDCARLPDKPRRLAIHGYNENHQECKRFRHLRSLVIFGYTDPLFNSSLSKILSGGPKMLEVLHLEGAKLTNIPKEVFQLFRLKFLNLRDTGVQIIPPCIGKLHNLEYLNLIGTKVRELPVGILQLRKLRILLVYHIGKDFALCGVKPPSQIGNLLFLEILHSIDADHDKTLVMEIGKLTQLRKLGISKLRKIDGAILCSSLGKLTNLRQLCVNSIKEDDTLDLLHPISPTPRALQVLELGGRLEMIPPWVASLQNLTTIQLFGSRLRHDLLESLQSLPNLVDVSLNNAYEGEELYFMAGGFQKLKRLELTRLQKLKCVRVGDRAMPCLHKLVMAECKLVEKLPWGIQNLNELKSLGLADMSNELIVKLQDKGSEEYQKIALVSEVVIANWKDGKLWKRFL